MPVIRALLASLWLIAASRGGELHFTEAGPKNSYKGDLVELSEEYVRWRDENKKEIREPLKVVLAIDLQPVPQFPAGLKYTDLQLTDGSLLHCSKLAFKGKEVELVLAVSEKPLKVPLVKIAYLLNDAQDPAVRQEWHEKIIAKKGKQDIAAVRLNDIINPIEGALGEVNDQGQIAFEYQTGGSRRRRDLDPTRVLGLVFFRTGTSGVPAALPCEVRDVNQNVWNAQKVAFDGKSFSVTTVAGIKLEYPSQAVARLDYGSGKSIYLSDLKPAEIIEKTKQGRKDNLRIDKNLENGTLQLEGQPYRKGLAIHAHTELVYNLDGNYKKFQAIVGMDDTVGGDGQPLVKIEADGKELFRGVITRKDKCQKLDQDVTGAKQLHIVVTSTGLFDFGDHVDIVNARLSK
jgi:hypothetical protein